LRPLLVRPLRTGRINIVRRAAHVYSLRSSDSVLRNRHGIRREVGSLLSLLSIIERYVSTVNVGIANMQLAQPSTDACAQDTFRVYHNANYYPLSMLTY